MRALLFKTLLCASTATLLFAATLGQDENGKVKPLVCYWESWSQLRTPPQNYSTEDIPVHLCSHVIYMYAGINETDWTLRSLFPTEQKPGGGYEKFAALKKKNPSVKLLLALGNFAEGGRMYSAMAEMKNRRTAFIRSTVSVVEKFNFDGVDMDWNFPGVARMGGKTEDKQNFVSLVRELREAFSAVKRSLMITAGMPASSLLLQAGYDIPALIPLIDHIHTKTYCMRDYRLNYTDVHSPLHSRPFDGPLSQLNVADTLALFVKLGAPKSKIFMGIPLYGRSFKLSNRSLTGIRSPAGPGFAELGEYTKQKSYLAYFEICTRLSNGWTRGWDAQGLCPYAYHDDQWVGYEDAISIRSKIEYLHREGYGGVSAWAIDLDDSKGICGRKNHLLQTIHQWLRQTPS